MKDNFSMVKEMDMGNKHLLLVRKREKFTSVTGEMIDRMVQVFIIR